MQAQETQRQFQKSEWLTNQILFDSLNDFLSRKEAATVLGISISTLQVILHRRLLKRYKMKNRILLSKHDLKNYVPLRLGVPTLAMRVRPDQVDGLRIEQFDIDGVAILFKTTKKTIRNMVRQKKIIPSFRKGRYIFTKQDIKDFLEKSWAQNIKPAPSGT